MPMFGWITPAQRSNAWLDSDSSWRTSSFDLAHGLQVIEHFAERAGPTFADTLPAFHEPAPATAGGQARAVLGTEVGLGAVAADLLEVVHQVVDLDAFVFRERVLTWRAGAAPANVVEEVLQRELLARLEPIRFRPTFFSVNAGLALRF